MNSQITALQWLDDRRFLVGCGPTLSLYDARSSQSSPVWSLDAFDHERIHGIRMNSYTSMNDSRSFLVFGAKSLRLGKIHGDQCEFTSQEIHLNDWIIDVLFLEDHANVSKPTLAALYAHNMVTILDTLSFQSLQTVKCNDLCVLYSGHLSGSTPHNLTITSGTAFREIIIWKFSQGGYIAKKLMGHGGPVHGVKFISNGREIVSCSEDRTLRRWDIARYVLGNWRLN